MRCPGCSTEMKAEAYEGQTLDFCPRCGGVFAEKEEAARVVDTRQKSFDREEAVQALGRPFAPPAPRRARQCPDCSKPMRELDFGRLGVLLDVCPDYHGVYFDATELEKVQALAEKLAALRGDSAPGGLLCPHCFIGLRAEAYEGEEIDRCPACGGTWLQRAELRQAINRIQESVSGGGAASSGGDSASGLLCPQCRLFMDHGPLSAGVGVEVERCERGHGYWLDRGELEKVQGLFEDGEVPEEAKEDWNVAFEKLSSAKWAARDAERKEVRRHHAAVIDQIIGMMGG